MKYSKGLIDRTRELLDFKTQAEMADYFGVTRKQVSEWRVGNSTPPYLKFIKIAEEHNVNLNWFFFGIGKKYLSSNDVVELYQDVKANNQLLVLSEDLSEYEKNVVSIIVDCLPYVPKAFFKKMIQQILDYKKQFEEIDIFDDNKKEK